MVPSPVMRLLSCRRARRGRRHRGCIRVPNETQPHVNGRVGAFSLVRAYVSQEVVEGPATYTQSLGGYERMLNKHQELGITAEQRFRFASLMSLAADDAGMPVDPEFRSALIAYLEWGTRLALGNSQPGVETVEHAPVPRWGWGEAPPYQP
jgi:hypothetical protein